MKNRLIMALLASSTLLFSGSIVGTWTIDKNGADKLFKKYANSEMDKMVIAMMFKSLKKIEFKKDGSCKINAENRSKCWKKSSQSSYTLYEKDGSDKGVRAKAINPKQIEINFKEQNYTFVFNKGTSKVIGK